jgi:N-acetylneuraminate synthase
MAVTIIAEAGVNHNGSIEIAKNMVDVAAEAGCDIIKFQTFKAKNLVTQSAKRALYQIQNTGNDDSQYKMLKELELDYSYHKDLIEYCNKKNIKFLSTPFDEESVDFLHELNMDIFKIPSGEITNKPFLKLIASKNKPIILSTGMSTLGEVEEALTWIYEEGNSNVALLHCTSDYPTKKEDVNLKSMLTLREAFKVKVGYSDHTLGIEIPIAAVALGAEIIEKHFTLDKNMEGPDHKASLEPNQLKDMVASIRNVERALGDGIKKPTQNEMETLKIARKSVVIKALILKDEIITRDKLCIKRPGTGMEPKNLDNIIGKRAARDLHEDEIIKFEDLC